MKRRLVLGLASLALVVGGGLVSCKTIDYENATYAELKEVEWDSKTVKYQYLNDTLEGYGAYWPVCLNLYEDGTAASWQATVTGFHVTHWADEEHYVLWDFYGTWVETESGIHLKMKGEGFEVTSDFGTNKTPELLEYDLTLSSGKGEIVDYALIASVGANIKGLVSNDGKVHYATFEDFFNSYKDNYTSGEE